MSNSKPPTPPLAAPSLTTSTATTTPQQTPSLSPAIQVALTPTTPQVAVRPKPKHFVESHEQQLELQTYKVQEGDSIASLALKFHMEMPELASLNRLSMIDTIFPGQILKVKPYTEETVLLRQQRRQSLASPTPTTPSYNPTSPSHTTTSSSSSATSSPSMMTINTAESEKQKNRIEQSIELNATGIQINKAPGNNKTFTLSSNGSISNSFNLVSVGDFLSSAASNTIQSAGGLLNSTGSLFSNAMQTTGSFLSSAASSVTNTTEKIVSATPVLNKIIPTTETSDITTSSTTTTNTTTTTEQEEEEEKDDWVSLDNYGNAHGVNAVKRDVKIPQLIRTISVLDGEGEKEVTDTILQKEHIEKMHTYFPVRYQQRNLRLIFTSKEHGFSLISFYKHCENVSKYFGTASLLVIQTVKNEVIGALVGEVWHPDTKIYGNGESFVFDANQRVHKWSKKNHCFQFSDSSHLYVGASVNADESKSSTPRGAAITILDSHLEKGASYRCETFGTDVPLTTSGTDFDIVNMEVWCFDKFKN